MEVPNNAMELVLHFEGFYPKVYRCPANIPTIGIGTIRYPNGNRVTMADPEITRLQATEYMENELQSCVSEAARICPLLLTMPEQCLGAIADFVYNLGASRLQASTLRRKINNREWEDIPTELRRWVMGGGKRLKGLVLRREAEAEYFL